ncbi:MAG: CoB--CoM heterodisulfide reductase iron-sulfur subunit A family protein [Chloroflexi bacterium]|nr:CoB--CoM heterodisulfide reductase iron-sulfur subunit A family protein [Chloroflexota bacterium]
MDKELDVTLTNETTTRAALVIGGGIAGIQTSLDLADMGINVHLVERLPSIGGRMAQLDKTFPTNDCSTCILSPKMNDCARHPNITLHTYAEVTALDGASGDFTVTLLKHPRYVDEVKCTGCGECVLKCPVKVPDVFDMELRERKAIHLYFPQAIPQVTTIDAEHCIYLDRGKCGVCAKVCEADAVDFEQTAQETTVHVGAVVLAAGYDFFDPRGLKQFSYEECPNIITALEYERLISASGPTGGHLLRPSDEQPAKRIGFIQCVGSRDVRHQVFCSSVCCMHSSKQAVLAAEHDSDAESTVFYADFRASGKGFREYVARAEREYGVRYVRSRVARVAGDEDSNPVIHYEDADTSRPARMTVDLAVLATSLIPRPDTAELAQVLDVELDSYGFVKTEPLTPVDTTRPGIFAAGCCRGPFDIPDSVVQASAAAARAARAIGDN